MKNILFRADGNARIGAGHVMRCLALGMAAKQLGVQCKYITADDSFKNIIVRYGFENMILHTDYTDMECELLQMGSLIEQFHPDAVVVDSYYVTEEYLKALKKKVTLAYIDDIKKFVYPVDYLINYNAGAIKLNYATWYKENDVAQPRLLLGERYVPLRREFQNIVTKEPKRVVSDIFFSAGGADPERVALQFTKEVLRCEQFAKYRFHLVLGSFEPDIEEIKKISNSFKQIVLHQNVQEMSKLMQQCDIAVSAAGSTLYELCACGIPTITYVLADNQILGETSLCQKEIMKSAGDIRSKEDFWRNLMELITQLCDDLQERRRMRNTAMREIDGNGARRVVECIAYGKEVED